MIFDLVLSILSTVLGSTSIMVAKEVFDRKQNHQESKEIQEDADKIIGDAFKSDDVIDLMLKTFVN